MYAEVDDGEPQGYIFSVNRTNALNVLDQAPYGLRASAYQEYQEHKEKSHLAETGLRYMNVVEARRYW
jgi:hypothetical protein